MRGIQSMKFIRTHVFTNQDHTNIPLQECVQKYKNKIHAVIKRHQELLCEAHPEIFPSSGWSTSLPEGSLEFGCLWRKDLELRFQTWLPENHQKSRINAPPGRPSWEAEDSETVWGFLSTKGI